MTKKMNRQVSDCAGGDEEIIIRHISNKGLVSGI